MPVLCLSRSGLSLLRLLVRWLSKAEATVAHAEAAPPVHPDPEPPPQPTTAHGEPITITTTGHHTITTEAEAVVPSPAAPPTTGTVTGTAVIPTPVTGPPPAPSGEPHQGAFRYTCEVH